MLQEFKESTINLTTVSIFFVVVVQLFFDYGKEIGFISSNKNILAFAAFPALYAFNYVFISLNSKVHGRILYLKYLNLLNIFSLGLFGFFISVIVSESFWSRLGLINYFIYGSVFFITVFSLTTFFSLLGSLFLKKKS